MSNNSNLDNDLDNKFDADGGKNFSLRNSKSGKANDALLSYDEELTNFITQRGDYIINSFEDLKRFVDIAFDDPQKKATAYFGIIPSEILSKIEKNIPNLPKALNGTLFKRGKDYSIASTLDSVRHLADEKSLTREDVIDYLDRMADTIVEFDSVTFDYYYEKGNRMNGVLFKKEFNDGTIRSFEIVSNKKRTLNLQTVYLENGDYTKKKSAESTLMENPSADVQDEERSNLNDRVPQNSKSVKGSFSLKDSNGNTLTEAQQEYFEDSKVRDENGNKQSSVSKPKETAEEKRARQERMKKTKVEQQKRAFDRKSSEQQEYLNSQYEKHRETIENLKQGDVLIDEDGNVVAEVTSVYNETGIMIVGEHIINEIPVGFLLDDTIPGFLEMGYKFVSNKQSGEKFSLKTLGYENKIFDFEVTQSDINQYIENAYLNENEKSHIKFLKVRNDLVDEVSSDVDITGYSHALRDNDIRHIKNSHGKKTNEKYPVTEADIELIPYVVENYDKVFYKTNANGDPGLIYVKVMPGDVIYYVEAITTEYNGEKLLVNKQMVKTGIDSIPNLYGLVDAINKKQSSSQYLADLNKIRKAYVQDVKENYSKDNITQPPKSVNGNFFLIDSEHQKTVESGDEVETNGNANFSLKKIHITADMSDSDRTKILSTKSIVAPLYEGQADSAIKNNLADLNSGKIGLVKNAVVAISEQFGIVGSDIQIEDVDVKITLSKSNIKESVSKEITPTEIAKLMPVLKESVSNAVGVERHDNRYYYDTSTVYFENLLGGYADGEYFVPVRFGLKHSKSGKTTLYVVVDQNKIPIKDLEQIKKTEVVNTAASQKKRSFASRSVEYNISQIIPFVKNKDLLRYIPDNMLDVEQKTNSHIFC